MYVIVRNRRTLKRKYRNDLSNPKLDISIPGLTRLHDSSYGTQYKAIWLFTVSCCAIACLYFTVERVKLYFSAPVSTTMKLVRHSQVQFPAFSICHYKHYAFMDLLKKNFSKDCQESDEACFNALPLPDNFLENIDMWSNEYFHFSVKISNSDNIVNKSYTINYVYTALGHCFVVRHIEKIPYFSARTNLSVTIHSKFIQTPKFMLVAHGLPTDKDFEFGIIEFESEFINVDTHTQIRLKKTTFSLKNSSSKPCFDSLTERRRIKSCAFERLHKICKLPYLPHSYRKCENISDVKVAVNHTNKLFDSLLKSENCSGRNICSDSIFAISVDSTGKSLNPNLTTLTLKFFDDTVLEMNEYFYYSGPSLISDLFAYWGFFLCLSALVFVEILDYILRKLHYWCFIRGG